MDRYICKKCSATFNNCVMHIDTESKLVKVLSEYCTTCGSFDIGLTEHGKLLDERCEKLIHLEEISKNN